MRGVAEATAAITKLFSGALSDSIGRRKLLVVLGYALAAAHQTRFSAGESIGWVFAARFVDRIGKGIRGAPRDALVADMTPPQLRGAAYGLRQALDSVGAFIGPLLAMVLMALVRQRHQSGDVVAVVPAVVSVLLVVRLRTASRTAHAQRRGAAAVRKPERSGCRCLTGSSLHRRGVHPGAFQRSLSGAARARRRAGHWPCSRW